MSGARGRLGLLRRDQLEHALSQQDHEDLGGAVKQEVDVHRESRPVAGEEEGDKLDHDRRVGAHDQDHRNEPDVRRFRELAARQRGVSAHVFLDDFDVAVGDCRVD